MKMDIVYACLAMAQPPPPGTTSNPTGEMIKLLGMVAIFGIMMYVLMIRPQQKKAKEHAEMMKTLKPGDKVVTNGGILGVVVAVKDKSLSIRSAETKLEIQKSAILEVTERASGPAES
jgi:preprotein translocase subunit YajC